MQPFSSIYYATSSPATADTSKPKEGEKEGDSPSCCTRIMNVVKSVISWIVYIFTFGFVTVFDNTTSSEEGEKPPKLSDKKLFEKVEKMIDDGKTPEEWIAVLNQVGNTSQKDEFLDDLIGLKVDNKEKVSTYVSILNAFTDKAKRDETITKILDIINEDRHDYTSVFKTLLGEFSSEDLKIKAVTNYMGTYQIAAPGLSGSELMRVIDSYIPESDKANRAEAIRSILAKFKYNPISMINIGSMMNSFTRLNEVAIELNKQGNVGLKESVYFAMFWKCMYDNTCKAHMTKEQVKEVAAMIPADLPTSKDKAEEKYRRRLNDYAATKTSGVA